MHAFKSTTYIKTLSQYVFDEVRRYCLQNRTELINYLEELVPLVFLEDGLLDLQLLVGFGFRITDDDGFRLRRYVNPFLDPML
jgi:hypothetical protein